MKSRLPTQRRLLSALAGLFSIALVAPFYSLSAAHVYTELTVDERGYNDDAFVIHSGGTLFVKYDHDGVLDFTRGTLFTGDGVLAKIGRGTILWGDKTTTFRLNSAALIDVRQGTLIGGSHGNEDWSGNHSGLQVASGATFNGVEANVRVGRLLGNGLITSGYTGQGYQGFTFGVSEIGTHTFGGVLADTNPSSTGQGKYIKTGLGTQIFTGAHTFRGGLVIESGTVAYGNGGTTGSLVSNVNIQGGQLIFNRSNLYHYAGTLSGSGTLVKQGSGTLTLGGNNSSFSGKIDIEQGVLEFGNTSQLGTGRLNVRTDGVLRWAAGNSADISNRFSTSFGDNQFVTVDTNGNNVTFGSSMYFNQLTKLGAGSLTLSTANDFSNREGIKVEQGTLIANHAQALGTREVHLAANTRLDLLSYDYNISRIKGSGEVTGTGIFRAHDDTSVRLTGSARMIAGGFARIGGDSSFTGGTTLEAGTVNLTHVNGFGTGSVVMTRDSILNLQVAMDLTRISGNGTITGSMFSYDSSADFTLQPSLNGSGIFIKSGTGTLTLASNRTYSGAITINEGALALMEERSGGGQSIRINEDGTLILNTQTIELSTLQGTGTVQSAGRIEAHGSNILSELNITGSGSLHWFAGGGGSGQQGLLGHNTFTGGLSINGRLTFWDARNLGAGAVNLNGGALAWGGDNTADISSSLRISSGTLDLGPNHVTFASAITSSGTVTKTGTGTLTLSAANTASGLLFIRQGTVALAHANALGNANVSVYQEGATLNIGSTTLALERLEGEGIVTGGAEGLLSYNSAGNREIRTTLNGAMSLHKSGSGTLTIHSPLNLSGSYHVEAGTLWIESNGWTTGAKHRVFVGEGATLRVNAIHMDAANFSGTGTVHFAGDLLYQRTGATTTLDNRFTQTRDFQISGTGLDLTITGNNEFERYVTISDGATARMGHANALGSSTEIRVNTGTTLDVGSHSLDLARILQEPGTNGTLTSTSTGSYTYAGAGSLTISNSFSGTASILHQGTGTLTLAGNNTHTGGVTVTAGTLALAHANALGTGPLTLGGSAQVNSSATIAISQLHGSGQVNGSGTYTHDEASDFTSAIDFGGQSTLLKTGTGTLTLSGTSTFGNAATVSAGKLIVNGALTTSFLNAKGTATIGGRGWVSQLLMEAGTTLSPGNSIDTFSTQTAIMTGGTLYQWEIADALGAAGEGYDLFSVEQEFTLDFGANHTPLRITVLSLDATGDHGLAENFDPTANYQFTLASAQTLQVLGTAAFEVDLSGFLNPFDGIWSVHLLENRLELHYAAAIPEPGTYLLIVAGGLALYLSRRRPSAKRG